MIVADTSVAIPALLPWHRHHALAIQALPARTRLVAQVGVETYSVLTRLPPPHRVEPEIALAYLRARFEFPPAVLRARSYEKLLVTAAAEPIRGGAIYDALVGATARELGATLLTLDHRAERTYQRLGVDYLFVA